MSFSEAHTDGAGVTLKIPGAFLIAIPVFRNGDCYQLGVKLRYRVSNGVVLWSFAIHRADACFDDAFRESCDRAAKETELPIFIGSPEEEE